MPQPGGGSVPRVYERILVGTDGSETATRAVARAAQVAADTGAALTVLTAGSGSRAERIVAEAAALHGSRLPVGTLVRPGDPATVLLDEAERGYDLLVGNKGMTGAARFLLGSVPNEVSHHAPCALLVVLTS